MYVISVLLMMFLICLLMTSILSFTSPSVVKIAALKSFSDHLTRMPFCWWCYLLFCCFCDSRQLAWVGSHRHECGGQQFRFRISSLRPSCKLISFSLCTYDSVISQKLRLSLQKECGTFLLCLSSFWHSSFTFWWCWLQRASLPGSASQKDSRVFTEVLAAFHHYSSDRSCFQVKDPQSLLSANRFSQFSCITIINNPFPFFWTLPEFGFYFKQATMASVVFILSVLLKFI